MKFFTTKNHIPTVVLIYNTNINLTLSHKHVDHHHNYSYDMLTINNEVIMDTKNYKQIKDFINDYRFTYDSGYRQLFADFKAKHSDFEEGSRFFIRAVKEMGVLAKVERVDGKTVRYIEYYPEHDDFLNNNTLIDVNKCQACDGKGYTEVKA